MSRIQGSNILLGGSLLLSSNICGPVCLSSNILSKSLKIKIQGTIILLVLHGWETWSLTLREEYRPRVFDNRVLWRIFGPLRGARDRGSGENYIT
jgi:hypothetical protein